MTSMPPGQIPQPVPRQLRRLARALPADPVRPPAADPTAQSAAPAPRVRHQVRDGIAVVAFTAAASTGVAVALLLLARVAG